MYDEMDDAAKACKGKIIRSITTTDHELHIEFDDCTLILEDTMQSCCERRYMTCDDDLSYPVGQAFVGYRVASGPDICDDEYSAHDVQFLIVDAFLCSITVANHNVHNGYYGGFGVTARVTEKLPYEEVEVIE